MTRLTCVSDLILRKILKDHFSRRTSLGQKEKLNKTD